MQYAGSARFISLDESRTQVRVSMTYLPPAGMLGHAAARLTGMDPKSQLDDMLLRAKCFLETGRQPHDAAERWQRSSRTLPMPPRGSSDLGTPTRKTPQSIGAIDMPGGPG